MSPHLWATTPPYPAARPRRDAGPAAAGGQGPLTLPPPRITLWPFFIQENAGRGTVVSPQMRGPAIVDRMFLHRELNASANLLQASLLYSEDGAGQGSNQSQTTLPSGTQIWSLRSVTADAAVTSGPDDGLFMAGIANIPQTTDIRVGAHIPLADFFLKFTFKQPAVVGVNFYGHVRVLEQVDPELLLDYLA